jgi:hypothetical protein
MACTFPGRKYGIYLANIVSEHNMISYLLLHSFPCASFSQLLSVSIEFTMISYLTFPGAS